jgi:Bacteriophage HK97-gp10, putative tail-component
MSDGFTIQGNASNVVAQLDSINETVSSNLKTVVETLEAELLSEIKARTPVRGGALERSIEGKVISTQTGTIAHVTANPTGGAAKGSRRAYYALFIEYGTKTRVQKTTGRKVGEIVATHFMHGPFDEMKERIRKEIEDAVKGI